MTASEAHATQRLLAQLRPVLDAIERAGGRPLVVGGAVRDALLGRAAHDADVEVYGLAPGPLAAALAQLGRVEPVGRAFGVLKLRLPGERAVDVALPQRRSRNPTGERGFLGEPDPAMTFAEAAARRDFTWNAMALTPAGELLDLFGGAADLRAGVIRHVSELFGEDPLRVLRAVQLAARFDMRLAPETAALCRELLPEAAALPPERVWGEWQKWALAGRFPRAGLAALLETGWLALYPELAALVGCPQDAVHHPEGWSITELPAKPSITRSADTFWTDSGLALREFIARTSAAAAVVPRSSSASAAQTIEDFAINSLTPTYATGTNSSLSPSLSGPTVFTQTESFVWKRRFSTFRASKIVRVVFEISLNRMRTIMLSAIDDLEIIRVVIHPVAVYVMNMFPVFQRPTDLQFHDNPMNTNTASPLGVGGIDIAAVVMDASTAPVNDNMFCYFDFSLESNSDAIDMKVLHNPPIRTKVLSDDITLLIVSQGDVWTHTGYVCDAAAQVAERESLAGHEREALLFAALCHDLGKPATTVVGRRGEPTSPGHAKAGVSPTEALLARIGAPRRVVASVAPLVREHMAHMGAQVTERAVRRLALRLEPATIALWELLLEADASGRPPRPPARPGAPFAALAGRLGVAQGRPAPLVQGRHLLAAGVAPGPQMGALLRRAYQAQVDGAFATLEEGLAWLTGAGGVSGDTRGSSEG